MSAFATIFIIGIGATIGASMRYYLTQFMHITLGRDFPYGTLSANVVGSFLAGILVVTLLEKTKFNETYQLVLLVGLTGSLTTMSTLSWESVEMINLGHYAKAAMNILLNVFLSLFSAGLGVVLARYVFASQ